MAFVFCVNLDEKIATRVIRHAGDKAYVTYVGMDDDRAVTYSLIVGIATGAGCDEYYFQLVEVDAETGEIREEYWDGRKVGEFISGDDREKILLVLLRVTRLLMQNERPDCFYSCTHGDNMPPPALEKHEKINEIFVQCGYRVDLTNSDRGRYSWWVERA